MSPTSRSRIHVVESTPSMATTEIQKANRTSPAGSGSASSRSSKRHDALIAKLEAVVNVLVQDAHLEHSLLRVFPGVLEGAVLRFQSDVLRREHRRGVTSSTHRGHFMDSRDRGPKTRAEREEASQDTVKARRRERDQEFINRGD